MGGEDEGEGRSDHFSPRPVMRMADFLNVFPSGEREGDIEEEEEEGEICMEYVVILLY